MLASATRPSELTANPVRSLELVVVAQCYINGDLAFAIAATIEAALRMRTIDNPRA